MPASPHDALVKRTFTDLDDARGELRAALPTEIESILDRGTLHLESGPFVAGASSR